MLYLLSHALFVIFAPALPAANVAEPTMSWNGRSLVTCLTALREPLNLAPTDQDLLGRVEMAYVELSFGGLPVYNGALGPWLEYAEEVSSIRQKLRAGAAVKTLDEALPDLWLEVMRGDTRAAMAGLAAFPEAAQSSAAHDLRLAATRDHWQDLEQWRHHRQPLASALGRYAFISACYQQGTEFDAECLGDLAAVDPLIVQLCRYTEPDPQAMLPAIRVVYSDLGWMIDAARLPDALARHYLTALLEALGGSAPPASTRATLAAAVQTAVSGFACDRAEALVAGYKICRDLRRGTHGIGDGSGHYQLFGDADLARWLQDRLYVAAALQSNMNADDWHYTAQAGALIAKDFPNGLLAARTRASISRPKADGINLGRAIQYELDDPLGLSPGTALFPFERYVYAGWNDAIPTYLALVQRLWPNNHVTRSWGLDAFCIYAPNYICRDAMAPVALAAHQRDPYAQRLWDFGRYAEPTWDLTMVEDLLPALTRIDAQVDITTMPVPGTAWQQQIVGRWQGWLNFDASGSMELAIECDDFARLTVGGEVLLRSGWAGRVEKTLHLAPGWQPLTLEWYQHQGQGKMRLLSRPENGAWQPMAADHLAHGATHEPGLLATYWRDVQWERTSRPRHADRERLANLGWLLPVRVAVAEALTNSQAATEAVTLLRQTKALGMESGAVAYAWAQALAYTRQPEAGRDLLDAFVRNSCCQNDLDYACAIGTTLNRAQLQGDFFRRLGQRKRCCVDGMIYARLALGQGDFAAALGYFQDLKLPPNQSLSWWVRFNSTILKRAVDGQEPNWNELRDLAENQQIDPGERLFLTWYTGQITWEQAVERMPGLENGEELLWFRGLHEITVGNYAVARGLIQPMIEHHPTWMEAADGGALLAWLAKQTPATLNALPKAKPLDRPLDKPQVPPEPIPPVNF